MTTRLMLVRHGPALHQNRLAGRRDIGADLSQQNRLDWLYHRIAEYAPQDVVVSPARRCLWTACALYLTDDTLTDARLWEQDFGEWEGMPFDELPDLGPLSGEELAAHRPPGGESFLDVASRVTPALEQIERPTLIVAHAGTIRAALAMVVGPVAALAFSVEPLSLTTLRRAGNGWAIEYVNATGPK